MVRFNSTLMNSMFGTSSNTASTGSSSSSETSSTIITGIALADSVDGEVLVQIGDPVEALLDEDNDIFVTIDNDDTVDNYDEDTLAEEPGEDDDEYDEEDFEETPTVYIGDDEEADESDEDPLDVEEVTE